MQTVCPGPLAHHFAFAAAQIEHGSFGGRLDDVAHAIQFVGRKRILNANTFLNDFVKSQTHGCFFSSEYVIVGYQQEVQGKPSVARAEIVRPDAVAEHRKTSARSAFSEVRNQSTVKQVMSQRKSREYSLQAAPRG
jgi:hypothetical protein